MHELSLAEDMRQIIEERAIKDGFQTVQKVVLEVGQLSHVEKQAMAFCFESVMKQSCAQDAELIIVSTPGQGRCRQCGAISQIEQLYDPCSHCGAFGLTVEYGDQVRIKSLEVS